MLIPAIVGVDVVSGNLVPLTQNYPTLSEKFDSRYEGEDHD